MALSLPGCLLALGRVWLKDPAAGREGLQWAGGGCSYLLLAVLQEERRRFPLKQVARHSLPFPRHRQKVGPKSDGPQVCVGRNDFVAAGMEIEVERAKEPNRVLVEQKYVRRHQERLLKSDAQRRLSEGGLLPHHYLNWCHFLMAANVH